MTRSATHRSMLSVILMLACLLGWTGCETVGQGMTKVEFGRIWDGLEAGQSQSEIFALLGEPRERNPAPDAAEYDTIWVYSQLETVRYETEISEGAVGPGGTGIPTYREVPVKEIVQYHLHWQDETLVSWERIER